VYGNTVLAHGAEDVPPFSPAMLVTQTDPFTLAALGLLVTAGLYLWGVLRLRARGDRWSPGRTAAFLIGLGLIGSVTVSGLGAYDTVLVSAHMVQHMRCRDGPIFLAGAPVTLAPHAVSSSARILLSVLHSRVARFYTFPIVSFGLFVATPFALYFSGLYRLALQYDWVHELMHLHFVAVGCLFFWPLLGLDPLPGRMSYPLRALLMFLSTPFHTVLGLTVMQSTELLGGDWYPSLELGWADPFVDQRLAGGILWAGGEFVSVAMIGALVIQWMKQSEREARRIESPPWTGPKRRRPRGPAAHRAVAARRRGPTRPWAATLPRGLGPRRARTSRRYDPTGGWGRVRPRR
jgi:putative copper resistance protein D